MSALRLPRFDADGRVRAQLVDLGPSRGRPAVPTVGGSFVRPLPDSDEVLRYFRREANREAAARYYARNAEAICERARERHRAKKGRAA